MSHFTELQAIKLTLLPLLGLSDGEAPVTILGSQSTFPSSLSSLMLSKETVPVGSLTTRLAISLLVRVSVPTSNSISSKHVQTTTAGVSTQELAKQELLHKLSWTL